LLISRSDREWQTNRQVSVPPENGTVPAVERAIDRASDRARRALLEVGREIHDARLAHGLSQSAVARSVGIAQSHVSEIEHGRHLAVPVGVLARIGASVGLDISLRAFAGGQPLRDNAHVALLARFRRAVGEGWTWAAEVPLPIPGDKRAWDRVLRGDGAVIGVEGETRPTDMQELERRLALKKRDGGVDRLILVMPNSEWCRRLVRLNDLAGAFPIPGRVALKALAEGRDPGGDAVILI
jgi:transcriptional regulator with XRE-family HTH domain